MAYNELIEEIKKVTYLASAAGVLGWDQRVCKYREKTRSGSSGLESQVSGIRESSCQTRKPQGKINVL